MVPLMSRPRRPLAAAQNAMIVLPYRHVLSGHYGNPPPILSHELEHVLLKYYAPT